MLGAPGIEMPVIPMVGSLAASNPAGEIGGSVELSQPPMATAAIITPLSFIRSRKT